AEARRCSPAALLMAERSPAGGRYGVQVLPARPRVGTGSAERRAGRLVELVLHRLDLVHVDGAGVAELRRGAGEDRSAICPWRAGGQLQCHIGGVDGSFEVTLPDVLSLHAALVEVPAVQQVLDLAQRLAGQLDEHVPLPAGKGERAAILLLRRWR